MTSIPHTELRTRMHQLGFPIIPSSYVYTDDDLVAVPNGKVRCCGIVKFNGDAGAYVRCATVMEPRECASEEKSDRDGDIDTLLRATEAPSKLLNTKGCFCNKHRNRVHYKILTHFVNTLNGRGHSGAFELSAREAIRTVANSFMGSAPRNRTGDINNQVAILGFIDTMPDELVVRLLREINLATERQTEEVDRITMSAEHVVGAAIRALTSTDLINLH